MTENWQFLSCIFNSLGRLDHQLYLLLTHDGYPREYRLLALESALRSGEIPMLGCRVSAFGLEVPERIEAKIDVETAIDISLDEITLRNSYQEDQEDPIGFAVFRRVQADMDSLERHLLDGDDGEGFEVEDSRKVKGGIREDALAGEKGMQRAIKQAVEKLWPDGVPVGLLKKNRNVKICELLSKEGLVEPDERTIRRAIRGK
jgi:hypothetical protein